MTKKKAKQVEDRRSRFERLGERRMNRELLAIRLLGNLASSNYKSSEHDVRVIEDALIFAIQEMKAKFRTRAAKAPPLQFQFPAEEDEQATQEASKQTQTAH